ncbi:MAG: VOC family protein [Pseudomonadota bacterium]
MSTGFTKRTTFVVDDAERASRFYREVFGWSVWYDNRLAVREGFPPCAPDGQDARLIMLEARDPKIGMLGFLAYEGFEPAEIPGHRERTTLRRGDAVLVMEADDVEETHQRAKAAGARIVNPPARWTVPSPQGGDLEIYTMSMFDPCGIYSEVSQSR